MTAPWGLAGGGNGTFSVKRLERGTETVELRALSTTEARKGDRFVIETSGGGGYGTPAKRARDNVLSDMADGLVYEEKLK